MEGTSSQTPISNSIPILNSTISKKSILATGKVSKFNYPSFSGDPIDILCTLVADQAKILSEQTSLMKRWVSALELSSKPKYYCHTHGVN